MNKTAFVGIDISKKKLDVAIWRKSGELRQYPHIQISNDRDGFKEMKTFFKENGLSLTQTVIGMESTGMYGLELRLFLEEEKVDYCVYMPLDLKKSMGLSRGKNDCVDDRRIAYYTWLHRDELRYARLAGSTMRKLQELNAERKRYVEVAAQFKTVRTENKDRKESVCLERNAAALKNMEQLISEVEKEMQDIIESDESLAANYRLLLSIKGIGPVNAISTLIHTDNFRAFENARQYACYIGVAPFEYSSDTSVRGRTRVSSCGAVNLKAELTQAAKSVIVHDPEIKNYYNRKREEGKAFGCVLNAVKFKLICRMFAVIKRGTPYVTLYKYAL